MPAVRMQLQSCPSKVISLRGFFRNLMSSFSRAFQNAGLCSLCENLKVIASSLTGLRIVSYDTQRWNGSAGL